MSRKAYFNDAAISWDEKYSTPDLQHLLQTLVPRFGLQKGQKVLDLGTGTGLLLPHLLQAIEPTGSIIAIDFAEKMVALSKAKFNHLKNVEIRLGDAEQLDLPSETLDAVTCFGLFPHLHPKEKALTQIYRILKPGGKLVIAHALSRAQIRKHHADDPAVAKDSLSKETEMRKLLKNAGFTVSSIEDKLGCYLLLATKK